MKYLSCILILYYMLCAVDAGAQTDTTQQIDHTRINSNVQKQKPYVILISADGFRHDYTQKFNATNLLALGSRGAVAASMFPSFPSLTFPNHYSIVTGLYPSHHGLVDNMFYDPAKKLTYTMSDKIRVHEPQWYGGTPLWVLAEKQKMLSASFYWVGSETKIKDVLPTYYYNFSELIPMNRRLKIVRDWLSLPEDKRPHLITFYFSEADHSGHMFGPDAPETADAVHLIDKSVGQLAAMTDSLKLPVNFVFVSDHGMTMIDAVSMLSLPTVLADTTMCTYTNSANLVHVYVKNKTKIDALYNELQVNAKDYDVYLTEKTPPAWHYSKNDDRFHRLGDIIIATHFPKVFQTGKNKVTPGKHGFDPKEKDMQATFIAWGPQIKKSGVIPSFENVNVYPLIASILGLDYTEAIDGKVNVLLPLLKTQDTKR